MIPWEGGGEIPVCPTLYLTLQIILEYIAFESWTMRLILCNTVIWEIFVWNIIVFKIFMLKYFRGSCNPRKLNARKFSNI